MRKLIALFSFLFLCGAAFGQLSQFRMIGSGSWTTVNDSTFSSTVTIQSDLTSNGFLPTGITDTMKVFSQTGQRYRISSATNLTFSGADLIIVESGGDWAAPVGQILIYENQGREAVPSIPFSATGSTAKMQEAVISYNSNLTGEVIDGDKGEIIVSGGNWLLNNNIVDQGNIVNNAVTNSKIATDAIDQSKILDGEVTPSEIQNTTVTPGSYTNINATIDEDGRITAASNGSSSEGGQGLTVLDTTFTSNYVANTDSIINMLTSVTESNDIVVSLPEPSKSTVAVMYTVNQVDRNNDDLGFTLVQVDGVGYDFYNNGDTLQFVSFTPDVSESYKIETIYLDGAYRWNTTKISSENVFFSGIVAPVDTNKLWLDGSEDGIPKLWNPITQQYNAVKFDFEVDSIDQVINNKYPIGSRVTSKGLDGKGEAIYYSYSSIPSNYPAQSTDSRFVFQDASSNYIVYQPDQEGRYNTKALGMVADWNHSTRTGTDNTTVFNDILTKLATGNKVYIPNGDYGFSTVTNLDFSPTNFILEGESQNGTKLYFLDSGVPITLTDAYNIEIKDFSAQAYDASGAASPVDFMRFFNVDSITVSRITLDTLNMVQTSHGPSGSTSYNNGCSNLTFEECKVYNGSNAYTIRYVDDLKIKGGLIYNSSSDGIKFNKYTYNWVIDGVEINDSADDLIDTYGGGFNGVIQNCTFVNGEVELKSHAKANVADNIKVINNNFTNATIKSDEGSYSPLTSQLRFDLAADGTITHNLNLPTTDNSFLEVKAYQDGTTTEVTFTTSSITEDAFDFTLTSGSYPVTVIVNTVLTSSTNHPSVYRTYNQVSSGSTTLELDPNVNSVVRELNFGEPTIIAYRTTDYTVVDDGVTWAYSTWGDTLTLNWSTPLAGDRLYVIQVGMDGVKGLKIDGNTFTDGQIFNANGSYEGVITNNTATYTTARQALQVPYALGNLKISNNYITYLDSVDMSSDVAIDLSQTPSTNEGVHGPGNYLIENNTVVNGDRYLDLDVSVWNNISWIIRNNIAVNPNDAVDNQGFNSSDGTELIDTILVTSANVRQFSNNMIITPSVTYRDRSPLINQLAAKPGSPWALNSDGTISFLPTIGDPTVQDQWVRIENEFQGTLDNNDFAAFRNVNTLRTTGGSTNRNYKYFNNTGSVNTAQSLDLRGQYDLFYNNGALSSQDVSIAKWYGFTTRIGAASGTGSIDTLVGHRLQVYNASGHGLTKFIGYDIDNQMINHPDTTIGFRLPDLAAVGYSRGILQIGKTDTSEFFGPVILHGSFEYIMFPAITYAPTDSIPIDTTLQSFPITGRLNGDTLRQITYTVTKAPTVNLNLRVLIWDGSSYTAAFSGTIPAGQRSVAISGSTAVVTDERIFVEILTDSGASGLDLELKFQKP